MKEQIIYARVSSALKQMKNGEVRVIPLGPQALELFRSHLDETIAALKKSPRRAVRTINAQFGLKLREYDLRHLFSTRAIENGVDVRTLADLIGHKDRGVTLLKRYAHARMARSREAVEMLKV